MATVLTLCIPEKEGQVLLGRKKWGFGEGKWNGFGGHVEEGETIEEAMKREAQEECGIEVLGFEKRGVLEFLFEGDDIILEIHVFSSSEFRGEPCESDEMWPQWFAREAIPFEQMWADDQHWFPLLFQGKTFRGKFFFRDHDTITKYELQEEI